MMTELVQSLEGQRLVAGGASFVLLVLVHDDNVGGCKGLYGCIRLQEDDWPAIANQENI